MIVNWTTNAQPKPAQPGLVLSMTWTTRTLQDQEPKGAPSVRPGIHAPAVRQGVA